MKILEKVFDIISNLSDELWHTFIFIILFLLIAILTKLEIYIINANISYSFTLAAILFSISQIIPKERVILSKSIYLLAFIFLVVMTNVDTKGINYIRSFLGEDVLLILSLVIVFIANYINIYKSKKHEEFMNNIKSHIKSVQSKSLEQNKKMIHTLDEINSLIKSSDLASAESKIEQTKSIIKSNSIKKMMGDMIVENSLDRNNIY